MNWSPSGSPQGKYSHSMLRWKWNSLNGTVEISASVNEPIQWHGVRMSNPFLQFGNSIQTNSWKLESAFLIEATDLCSKSSADSSEVNPPETHF